MTIFSPDGKYGYVCSSFSPQTVVIDTRSRKIVGRVTQESPFCPDIAATPDGKQVWLTLKDIGHVMVFDARPPFKVLKSLDTGPITNHVNIAKNRNGQFAYVTVATENVVKVFRTSDFAPVAAIPVGSVPHGLWPSGDGTRLYVGLENGDGVAVIDTLSNKVIATIPIGQGPQGVAYIPGAVPSGPGTSNLVPLDEATGSARIALSGQGSTQVTLFNQGPLQILQAVPSGLQPGGKYVLALSRSPDGSGPLQPLAAFTANPAGSAVVNAVGPIRQAVTASTVADRRFLVVATGTAAQPGAAVQVQDSR
jgi:YVTN family beta-propeller protein